jgi:hypothetical protein
MVYMTKNTKIDVVAINDNHTMLEAMRNRRVRTWAEDLAHQLDRQRFLKAWVQVGQLYSTNKAP